MDEQLTAISRVPVTVLTGFLGAGKTTLLRHLLSISCDLRLGVLVNDFGPLNIDAELIVTSEAQTVQLANGCICCTLKDDLSQAVLGVLDRPDAPEHLVIEASGIADPLAIVEAMHSFPLNRRIRVDAVIAVVDGEQYPKLSFQDGETALAQLAVADLALINKMDLADPKMVAQLRQDLALIVPKARVHTTCRCELPSEILLGHKRIHKDVLSANSDGQVHDHHWHEPTTDGTGTHGFHSSSWVSDRPLSLTRFREFVNALPTSVYRAKGVAFFSDYATQRAIFQLVGKRSSIDFDGPWLSRAQTRLTFITRTADVEWNSIRLSLEDCAERKPG